MPQHKVLKKRKRKVCSTGQWGEISIWLTKKNNAWLNKESTGDWGWEEMPYWLKGYANIGYVLKDKKMMEEAMV